MNKLIIVEGPQGVGKTTVTNWLREQIPYTNLFRLSGHNERGRRGLVMSETMYGALDSYIRAMQECGMHLLFDRTFITEQVYCMSGYKDYKFTQSFNELIHSLDTIAFDVHIINLRLSDMSIYGQRLLRDKPQFHNVKFSVNTSIAQQAIYTDLMDTIRVVAPRISVHDIYTDSEDGWKRGLSTIFGGIGGVMKPQITSDKGQTIKRMNKS